MLYLLHQKNTNQRNSNIWKKNTEGFGQCKKKYEERNIIIDVSKVFPFKSRESQDKNKHVYEDCPINFNRLSHLVYNKEREVKKN